MSRYGKSLKKQAAEKYEIMYANGKGTSKREVLEAAKKKYGKDVSQATAFEGYIFSEKSMENYKNMSKGFFKFCHQQHGCVTLDECQAHIKEWEESLEAEGKSPSTIHGYVYAVRKLYGEGETFALPIRARETVTRSRNPVEFDKHCSEKNNAEIIEFQRATGLRCDKELAKLRGGWVGQHDDGKWYVQIRRGKGNKPRESLIAGTPEVVDRVVKKIQETSAEELVFKNINAALDIHNLRHEYALNIYRMYARNPDELDLKDRICCKKDFKGLWLDRAAALQVSLNLGHCHYDDNGELKERTNVVTSSYIYKSDVRGLAEEGVVSLHGWND